MRMKVLILSASFLLGACQPTEEPLDAHADELKRRCGDGICHPAESCSSCPADCGSCGPTCTPTTCAAQGKSCGTFSDGCGGTLSCGTCSSPLTCGGGGVANVCGESTTSQSGTFVATNSVFKYLDDGTEPQTAWRAVGFDDSSWKSGAAELGYGDGDEATVVGYGPSSTSKYITTYFRHSFSVASPGTYNSLTLRLKRDDGAVVFLNGTEVFRTNMPTGTINAATLASSAIDDETFYTATVSSSLLVPGQNVLALEIHQGSADSSDISMVAELIGNSGGGGCTPTTCAAQGKNCGTFSDGCGGTLSCGTCASGQTCGGGGVPNVCGSSTPTNPMPVGVSGTWTLVFSDEFNGTSLDTTKWNPNWFGEGGKMNNVGTYASNVQVANGYLKLSLSSSTAGALVHTGYSAGRYTLAVGGFVEARVYFPGDGTSTQDIYNWPAWWASGPNWPSAGEHDIAEGLGGDLTVNYHSPSGAHNQGSPAGLWGNAFHTYGLYRGVDHADVYWDGVKVRSYPTDDNNQPEELILNVGVSGSRTPVLGDAGAMLVDYVRAWK